MGVVSAETAEMLYATLIERWNDRDGKGFAACFTHDGTSIGFDGSTVHGRSNIAAHLSAIFADHETGTYVPSVHDVRALGTVTLLRAVVGMVPPGADDISPAANAIQTLVAVRSDDGWRIAQLQNTPAAFHGRPDDAAVLTEELRAVLRDANTR